MSVLIRFVPLLLAALLAGCYGDNSDLQRRIDQVKQRPGDPIEPLPSVEVPPSFEYTAQDLRSPFRSSGTPVAPEAEQVAQGTGPRPDFDRRREPLESFELDSLEMVGTLMIDDALYGLVEDPEGLLHRVQPDNYVGRNHGRIIQIYDDRIEIIELVPDGGSGWREQDAALALDLE